MIVDCSSWLGILSMESVLIWKEVIEKNNWINSTTPCLARKLPIPYKYTIIVIRILLIDNHND